MGNGEREVTVWSRVDTGGYESRELCGKTLDEDICLRDCPSALASKQERMLQSCIRYSLLLV